MGVRWWWELAQLANNIPAQDAASSDAKKRLEIKLPDDFRDEQSFLLYIRTLVNDDLEFDRKNREAGIEDSKFMVGDQWDNTVRARRARARKPILTVNRLPAFVAQLVGNRRLNETEISVIPRNDGTKAIAEIRMGLMRDVQDTSNADRAYDKAYENCVICSIGNFGVGLEYASNDVFDQDIKIKEYPNPHSIVWDRTLVEKTGRDAGHVTVIDTLPKVVFENEYPDVVPSDIANDQEIVTQHINGWFTPDDVRVAEFWRMRTRKRKLALMRNGTTVDITDLDDADPQLTQIAVHPKTNKPFTRMVDKPYAEMYKVCGTAVLDGPYELPISRVPVFRVPAWEVTIGDIKERWGLIRFMKDPQRLHNYWRSTIAEKLMMSPRARWVAPKESIMGSEAEWRNAHQSDDPLLTYNGEGGVAPTYVPPPPIEQGLLTEANMSVQDLRDVSNIHEAMLGQQSNEVSGKAITARQRVGETGTVLFSDNLNAAIEECGSVIDELIPVAYDTIRTIRVLGPDDKATFQLINDPDNAESVDITLGRYSVKVTTGPSFNTKRVEATESMLNMVNAAPQLMQFVADLIVQNQDWPGSDEIAKRLRAVLAQMPGGINVIDAGGLTEDEKAKQQQQQEQAAQQQQEQQKIQMIGLRTDLDEKRARTAKAHAEAISARADAIRSLHAAGLMDAQAKAAEGAALKSVAEAFFISVDASVQHEMEMLAADLRTNSDALEAEAEAGAGDDASDQTQETQ